MPVHWRDATNAARLGKSFLLVLVYNLLVLLHAWPWHAGRQQERVQGHRRRPRGRRVLAPHEPQQLALISHAPRAWSSLG